MTVAYPPPDPMPQRAAWERALTQIARAPLEYGEDFPTIARRHEAFWANELIDRPLFLASANTNPARPITRRLDLLHDPDAWFEAKLLDLEQTYRVGDTLPTVRVDFGPVILGALFGGETEFGADTSWTHAFIADDWSNAPDWTIDEGHPTWRLLGELTRRVAQNAAGRYVVMIPNLGGTSDALLNLRGSSALCVDVADQPEKIRASVDAIYPAWHQAFTLLYETIVGSGAGITEYLGLWANRPYVLTQCDFSAMIGPRPFETLFLPDIARQAATVGRAIHHLDGPDAARHAEPLLETPDLQAIQYVVGAGHSALNKLDMLRRIQARGKPLQVLCAFDDVMPLAEELQPQGLCFLVDEVPGPDALDGLFAQFCARYGCSSGGD
jgi:hypothetical protein